MFYQLICICINLPWWSIIITNTSIKRLNNVLSLPFSHLRQLNIFFVYIPVVITTPYHRTQGTFESEYGHELQTH